jgi:hypothetical protein
MKKKDIISWSAFMYKIFPVSTFYTHTQKKIYHAARNIMYSLKYCINNIFIKSSLYEYINIRAITRVWFLAGQDFSLHYNIQTSSRAHRSSYPMGTWVLSSQVKWLGHEAHHSPAYWIRMHGAIPPLPHIPAWWVAQLKTRDN